ncbi:proline--tRNA ligase [Alphaproteobacteria bacterium]|nr:proline--tRNA ligase [Alphaproteobacteria bacterium]
MFIKTSKTAPSDEVAKNAQLLIRAGFVHKRMAGVYEYLPLGKKVLDNIVGVIREEMNAIGGQEVSLTALQPKELWERTDRWDSKKVDIWFKTELSSGGEAGLAPTHEEPLTDIMTNFVSSYHDLPIYAYQFQTKFRNELRPKSGLMRGREFLMKDLYDFSKSEAEHQEFYEKTKAAYIRIFDRLGIGEFTYPTFASGGIFAKFSEEFQMLSPVGEDTVYVHNDQKLAVNDEVWDDETMKILGTKKDDFRTEKAVELGNIFHLSTKYSAPLGLAYTDENGQRQPVYMGCYGIGPSRVMGAIAEHFADERGLVWPENIAPARVYLINIGDDTAERTEKLYDELRSKGVEVIWDDRDTRPGEKFADAELMGIPYRVVVSAKLGPDEIELKSRTLDVVENLSVEALLDKLA